MTKLEIAKDVMITSECWSYDKFAILQTSPYFDLWLTNHMNIYMETKGGVVFGSPGQIYPLSYFNDILDISEIDIFKVEKNVVVDLLVNQIDQGYYVVLEMNSRKIFDPKTEEFLLHESLIYGYDEKKQIFFAVNLDNSGSKETQISYNRVREAYADARDFFLKDYRRRYWMRKTFFEITRIRLKDNYRNENAFYDCLKKIQNYIDISVYKEEKLTEDFQLEDVTIWYLGSACSIALADSIKDGIVDIESANRDYKFTYLSAVKIHENRSLLLHSMKWMVQELHVNNPLILRSLEQYQGSCSKMQIIIGMMQKFRFTQDVKLLQRAGEKLKFIYTDDQKILRDFVRNMTDCYMDVAFGYGAELLRKIKLANGNNCMLKKAEDKDVMFLYTLMNTPKIQEALHANSTTVDDWKEIVAGWRANDDEEGYLILDKDTPVGWMEIQGLLTNGQSMVSIKRLVIASAYQRRGIGEYILKETLKTLKLRGFIRVSACVDQENIPAKQCFLKCGFEVMEETELEMPDEIVVKCYRMEVLCY